jgi:hypothetical protein
MWNPVAVVPALSLATSPVHRAFARLDGADRRLVEAALFGGWTCAEIARSTGAAPGDIRRRIGAAMQALHGAGMPDEDSRSGAVAAMLALRALDALDPDEAAVIDAMLEPRGRADQDQRLALTGEYRAYCELVAELCMMAPRVAPRSRLVDQLMCATGDAIMN